MTYFDLSDKLDPDFVLFDLLKTPEKEIFYENYPVKTYSIRYSTFRQRRECHVCGARIHYALLQQNKIQLQTQPDTKRAHFNFYTESGVQMTKKKIKKGFYKPVCLNCSS